MSDKDYYTTLHRSMFARINEVGAKPFLLFQYYLTYQSASDGIRPSLKRIALDMGIVDKKGNPQISSVSHHKKTLIEAGWIKEENGEIIITLVEKNSSKLEKISSPDVEEVEKISTKLEKISTDDLKKFQQNLKKFQVPIYRNEKLIIKDREIRESVENDVEVIPPTESTPLKKNALEIYQEFYPSQHLSIYQQKLILDTATDLEVWRKTLEFWKGNNHIGKNIQNIINAYNERKVKTPVLVNGFYDHSIKNPEKSGWYH